MGILDRLRRGGRGPGAYVYPLDRTNDRRFPDGWEGDVFVWDIDKTYLESAFESLGGMLSIALETGVDKRAIGGAPILIHALRRGRRDGSTQTRSNPLYFVSASPPQLRRAIQKKMLIDGVEFDGITFKDSVALIQMRKVHNLKHQVGYKLSALLLNRRDLPWTAREHLFGDDSESDALIYALYADIVAGRLRGDALEATLVRNEVEADDAAYVRRLTDDMPQGELVKGIYIHLEGRSPPSRFAAYGPRVVPCYDTFQMATILQASGLIDERAVIDVGRALAQKHGYSKLALLRNALDLAERSLVHIEALQGLWDRFRTAGLVPEYAELDADAPPGSQTTEEAGAFVTPAEHLVLGEA